MMTDVNEKKSFFHIITTKKLDDVLTLAEENILGFEKYEIQCISLSSLLIGQQEDIDLAASLLYSGRSVGKLIILQKDIELSLLADKRTKHGDSLIGIINANTKEL